MGAPVRPGAGWRALWLNPVMDIDAIYAGQQEELATLVLERPDRCAEGVPACPGWEVRDVVAHVAGLASDAAAGSLPTMDLLEQWRDDQVAETRDRMTAGQVDRVADRSVDELLAEWREVTVGLSPMLRGDRPFPDPAPFGLNAILACDLVIHVQDVRGAFGVARAPDGPGLALALATYCFGVDYRIRELHLPALAVDDGARQRTLGDGAPAATVTGDRFELLRAFAGRRSRAQILALDWSGDPDPYLSLIPAYGERAGDLLE